MRVLVALLALTLVPEGRSFQLAPAAAAVRRPALCAPSSWLVSRAATTCIHASAAPLPGGGDGSDAGASGQQVRVRVAMPHADLYAATAATAKKKKKGIYSVTIGSKTINFEKDMTTSFTWAGITILLILYKVIQFAMKGNLRAAFFDEPNYKHIARNDAEEAELHEFCCENCGCAHARACLHFHVAYFAALTSTLTPYQRACFR